MPLTLHIFEERYKLMIEHCLEPRQPFGVVLIKHGQRGLWPLADPHQDWLYRSYFGRATSVRRPDEYHRFRPKTLPDPGASHEKPYLVGSVELFPLEETQSPCWTAPVEN
jgi:hypothetical protein